MNYLLNVALKLELKEGADKEAAQIVLDDLMKKVNDILEFYDFEDKNIENNISKIVHIDDNWEDTENKYNWR